MFRTTLRPAMLAAVLAAAVAALPVGARAQSEQQTLVDRATLAVQETVNEATQNADVRNLLRRSRAVMVCPRVFRAGFILGGSGGGCVLLARDGRGTWSYPAFYGMGSGSLGFQIGISDSSVLMLILTDKGLNAMMDSQFKFGGDVGLAVATVGAGVEGALTADLGADIVAFSQSRGLFAGLSLQGSVLGARTEWNRAYYGRDLAARQVVLDMSGRNPGAEPLREVLTRFGATQTAAAPPAAAAPEPAAAPQGSRAVQRQSLAPPRR